MKWFYEMGQKWMREEKQKFYDGSFRIKKMFPTC